MGCATVKASTTDIESQHSRGYKWIRGSLIVLSFEFKVTNEPWRYKGLVASLLPSRTNKGFATCFEWVVTTFFLTQYIRVFVIQYAKCE